MELEKYTDKIILHWLKRCVMTERYEYACKFRDEAIKRELI